MEENRQLVVHQTIHGYKEGHKLLSSSVELNATEKNALILLSDYSGTGRELNFSNYITGYPLPHSRFYAFAMTWYADEMPRPGCVWTHTLLLDISTLWTIEDVSPLLDNFKRPELGDHLYAKPLFYTINDFIRKDKELDSTFFELTCHFYSDDKSLVVLSDSSSTLQEYVLNIWSYQWPKLKRSFKFCTGALAPRSLMNELFDLQVLPYTRERFLNKIDREKLNIVELGRTKCLGEWNIEYNKENSEQVLKFMTQFGADVEANKKSFVALLKAYHLLKDQHLLNIQKLIKFFETYFFEPTEASQLKSHLVKILFFKDKGNAFDILKALMSKKVFSKIKWDYFSLIKIYWDNKQLSKTELLSILKDLSDAGLISDLLELLKILQIDLWIESTHLYSDLLNDLIKIKNIKLSSSIWTASEGVQYLWWNKIKEDLPNVLPSIVKNMLDGDNKLFAEELLKNSGQVVLSLLFDWILENDTYPNKDWQYLIKLDPIGAFKSIISLKKVNAKIFYLIPNILSPTIPEWKYLELRDFEMFFVKVASIDQEEVKTALYTFFLTSCLSRNVSDPVNLCALIFEPLHVNVENNFCDNNTWQRFKMEMGKDLYNLAELDFFSRIFKERQEIPEWDRCEFLRRSLISCFIKFGWDIEDLISIVKSRMIFTKIVEFGAEVKPIKKLLKALRKKLEVPDNRHPIYYYEILKKFL